MEMGFLAGKRAVVVGLASNRSIAWGIAQALKSQGAELAFNYQTEKLQSRVEKMAEELGAFEEDALNEEEALESAQE